MAMLCPCMQEHAGKEEAIIKEPIEDLRPHMSRPNEELAEFGALRTLEDMEAAALFPQDVEGQEEKPAPAPAVAPEPQAKAEAAEAPVYEGNAELKEFVVNFEKTSPQDKLGLEVEKFLGSNVIVLKLREGLITDYNHKAAREGRPVIKAGYEITEVNGVTKDPIRMVEMVRNNLVLKVRFLVK
eukprot:CAMPEP_0170646126 /NCGR_PEP_ID=MMETSP0224-20130122/43461_1 /TAXON_ID=285029 /ORGANISM="Togula jolla, Strain CCCM 725" /LENGTH=183 /DNA_ID=CAMNT_0010977417 /DNA_START=41 /DNA_END=592 /DNA_ORIENTATION=-